MIAANFRKEVTSTAMWLLYHDIKIKCIRVTPYELSGQILLDTEQIIPIIDAEDYLIKIANKKQEEIINREKKQTRHTVRIDFWTQALQKINEKSDLYENVSPSKDNWLSYGSGYTGLGYSFVVTGNYARIEIWILRKLQEENKEIFDDIYTHKDKIESSFGDQLGWQRRDDGKASRIAYWLRDVNIFNEEDWPEMINFLTSNMIKFEKSMKGILKEVFQK